MRRSLGYCVAFAMGVMMMMFVAAQPPAQPTQWEYACLVHQDRAPHFSLYIGTERQWAVSFGDPQKMSDVYSKLGVTRAPSDNDPIPTIVVAALSRDGWELVTTDGMMTYMKRRR